MDKKQDLAIGIPNSKLLPLESPWQFHKQKFGIGISIDRSIGPQIPYIESHSNIYMLLGAIQQI